MAGNAGERQLELLTKYGVNIGLGFQIADDILDAAAPLNDGPATDNASCLSAYSADEARARARELISTACSALAGLESEHALPLDAIAKYVIERQY